MDRKLISIVNKHNNTSALKSIGYNPTMHSNASTQIIRQGNYTFWIVLILILTPFIQLGYSFYISFQIISFLLVVILFTNRRIVMKNLIPFFYFFILMKIPDIVFYDSDFFFHSFLKSSREFVCLIVLLMVSRYVVSEKIVINIKKIKLVVAILTFGFFFYTLLQFFSVSYGSLAFFIPKDFFVFNQDTLPTQFDLLHGGKIRPRASFGEPSYLAFILTSILVIVLNIYKSGVLKKCLIATIFTTVIISKTLAGVLGVGLLLIGYHKSKLKYLLLLIWIVLLLISFGRIEYLSHVPILNRLRHVGDYQLAKSIYTRVIVPLSIIQMMLGDSPLGIPTDELTFFLSVRAPFMAPLVTQGNIDNGFLNVVINYGILSLFIMIIIVWYIRDRFMLFYLFIASNFNGTFFGYDKIAVMCTVLVIVQSFARARQRGTSGYRNNSQGRRI